MNTDLVLTGNGNPDIVMFHIEFFEPIRADQIVDFFFRFENGWNWRVSDDTSCSYKLC